MLFISFPVYFAIFTMTSFLSCLSSPLRKKYLETGSEAGQAVLGHYGKGSKGSTQGVLDFELMCKLLKSQYFFDRNRKDPPFTQKHNS